MGFVRKSWIIPFVILIILFVAYITRWEHEIREASEKNGIEFITIKFTTDKWTGRTWAKATGYFKDEGYVKKSFLASPKPLEGEDYARRERRNLTLAWLCATILTGTWFGYALNKRRGSQT